MNTPDQLRDVVINSPIADLRIAMDQFGGNTWVQISDGDRHRAPGNFAPAIRELLAATPPVAEADTPCPLCAFPIGSNACPVCALAGERDEALAKLTDRKCHVCGLAVVPPDQSVRVPSCECHIKVVRLRELREERDAALTKLATMERLLREAHTIICGAAQTIPARDLPPLKRMVNRIDAFLPRTT